MGSLTLVIGSKHLSSWSLRPWILMRHLGLDFEERLIELDQPDTAANILRYSPSGRLPALQHGDLTIWDSLAICEYVCELSGGGLPAGRAARALARAVAAEMHAGFLTLRAEWPMDTRATGRRTTVSAELAADLARIERLWVKCRTTHGQEGPWLFGRYSVADAAYAPVVLRFRAYGPRLGAVAQSYQATALDDTHLKDWIRAAATAA